jgi:hypothetical protein
MPDLVHADPVIGNVIVTFDGRVLECFSERDATSTRMIVGLLHLQVEGPNRKGRREVKFSGAPNNRGGGFVLWVDEEQWPAVEPFVNEVAAAL